MWLLDKFGSKCRTVFWRKVIFRVWLITDQNIMSRRAREPPQDRGYACIKGYSEVNFVKTLKAFSQLSVLSKIDLLKKI